jgi:hypothetical protein
MTTIFFDGKIAMFDGQIPFFFDGNFSTRNENLA